MLDVQWQSSICSSGQELVCIQSCTLHGLDIGNTQPIETTLAAEITTRDSHLMSGASLISGLLLRPSMHSLIALLTAETCR